MSGPRNRRDRDLRAYARSTQVRLLLGFLVLMVVVGTALVAAIYGAEAAKLALLCASLGFAPLALIFVLLWLLGLVSQRLSGG